MKYLGRFFRLVVFLGLLHGGQIVAQIFEPEGLNMPGTWNNFVNPPASGSVLGSEFQVNQGKLKRITTGTRRWQTGFYCNDTSEFSPSSQNFLFTSGPANNAFANKWSGTAATVNQLQNYAFNNNALPDNSINLDSGFYYTMNWRDAGYAATQAIFMKTQFEPVVLDSLFTDVPLNQVFPDQEIAVTVLLSGAPSLEERFFLRYSFDGFAGSFVIPMPVNGNQASATLPGFQAGSEIDFYVFSTTIQDPTSNYDMLTLRFLNNGGLNFGYSVINEATLLNLGPDFSVCEGSGPWDLAVSDQFDTYLWSTGSTDSAIVINEPGTYAVQVTLGAVTVADTITLSLLDLPVFNLGSDINHCGTEPFELNTGLAIGAAGDIITITYDASQGQTQLADLDTSQDRIYLHSGYEAVPFGGAVNWVGNWGADDGLGEMTYLGNNLWTITFNIFEYYSIPGNAPISGLFIVFRNADGTLTGKDDAGNDIFLSIQQNPPSSSFAGIEASIEAEGIQSVVWNTGSEASAIAVTQNGVYTATASTAQGCVYSDSVAVNILEVPALSLNEDTVVCSGNFELELQANGDFESFLWSTGETSASISVNSQDAYSVTATAPNGCTAKDTVNITVSLFTLSSQLNESYLSCGGATVLLNPGFFLSPQGDSLTIVYDATQGQSQLQGATSVYFHSTYEFAPFAGGVEPWVGNWGQDDGLGQMTSLGNDVWKITINVYDYYGVPLDSAVNGLFMVFRNADGTLTGKDELGNDIFLNLSTPVPSSAFEGITGSIQQSEVVSIAWSDGSTGDQLSTNQAGIYSVNVISDDGCTLSDSTEVIAVPGAQVNLGADRILCSGESANLNAGSGFATYTWSNGATQNSISVATAGTYSVVVSTSEGCVSGDTVNVQAINPPVAAFSVGNILDSAVSVVDLSTGPANYAWDFDGDGLTDNNLSGNVQYTYDQSGIYTITLVLTNFCGADTASANVTINIIGIEDYETETPTLVIFPNPAESFVRLAADIDLPAVIEVLDCTGRMALQGNLGADQIIYLDELTPGLYTIHVRNTKSTRSARLIMR
jgi:PKD repeat protein